jgi:hypothetical protein
MTAYHFQAENPQTEWLASARDKDRKMALLKSFTFFNSQGRDWTAPQATVIDGASIPRALWALVGSPYCGYYRRASIVHDWACDQAVGDPAARKRADRMFYEACRAGGCNPFQAMVLYLGVRIGAWTSRNALVATALAETTDAPRLALDPEGRQIVEMFQGIGAELPDDPPDDAEAVEQLVTAASSAYFAKRAAVALNFEAL